MSGVVEGTLRDVLVHFKLDAPYTWQDNTVAVDEARGRGKGKGPARRTRLPLKGHP